MRAIRRFLNILKESIKGISRNFAMSIASIVSIAAMLTLFGFIFILILNINSSVYHLGHKLDKVIVYLKEDIEPSTVNKLIDQIGNDDRVMQVQYTSKEQALEDFKERFGDKKYILDSIPENTLPASLVISLKDLSYSKDVVNTIKTNKFIERVDYHYDLIEKMMTFEKGVKYIGSAVVIALIFVAVLIIHNTIKIAVANRKREIYIMKYVGATNFYIRGPFLIEGIIFGIIGALIALLIVYFAYEYSYIRVNQYIENLFGTSIATPQSISKNISIIFLCIGVGIGYLGSLMSTKRFLDV
ncbi:MULTISPECIES: permease-like cell division protein FtsX [Peptoniphilus]|uniref:permease-like cell division protein FtsX n=1 Tax=Peptoniphilus TaxID=162289 RepID=UPI0002F23727|nr:MULTISPECIES: permease-like cell division protein FtsX [Peptoniphilus]